MPDGAATVTLEGVELVRVGTWAASTGVTTIATEDLEAMVAAAGDAEIDRAPLKLGHTGALAELGDSEPALGWVENLRVSDDGTTLLGDLVDVPAGISDALLAAYKRRSVEIAWGVRTPSGAQYRAALTGLALLGVAPPAVKGLADIAALYEPAKTAAAGYEFASVSALAMWDVAPDEPNYADRVRDQLRWARESAASLAALVGLDGLQAVFDALDTMAARGGGTDSRRLSAASSHDGAHDPTAPGGLMPKLDPAEIRKLLQLPADADDDTVHAELTKLAAKAQDGGAGEGDKTDRGAGGEAGGDDATRQPTAASGSEPKVVTLSAGQYTELQRQAAAGEEARKILRTQEIDGVVTTALSAGKFTVAEAPEYRTLLETNFDAGKALVDKLAAGKVPMSELGDAGPGPDGSAMSEAAIDKAIAEFFGEPVQGS